MDRQKLRTLVFEKTGVRIDVDDPVFALVALNEAVLDDAVERHAALLREANEALAAQVAALQGRSVGADGGSAGAAAAAAAPGTRLAPASAAVSPPAPVRAPEVRAATIAAGAAVLGALLVLGGQALLFRPAPVPAPVVLAKELTPEQSAAIRNGEKLARIVEKLDRKTRAAIAADMQKP
jgi:hypothetical protein